MDRAKDRRGIVVQRGGRHILAGMCLAVASLLSPEILQAAQTPDQVPASSGALIQLGSDTGDADLRRLAGPGARLVVLIFAASDCPIANRYIPEIARLTQQFSLKGVRFWWVFPNPDDTAAVVAAHNRQFSITGDAALDTHQSLVALAHATVTPEAAVFFVARDQPTGPGLREVYRGRIDDRYLSLGQERPQAQQHDLETAIAAALAGSPVPAPAGPPVGCSIVFKQK
jgi:hypothetical protein